jgi:hypothetical protein
MEDHPEYDPNEEQKAIARIKEKYRGINEGDLDEWNPGYSCVICSRFNDCGLSGHSCIEHDLVTEEQFALTYDFKLIINGGI